MCQSITGLKDMSTQYQSNPFTTQYCIRACYKEKPHERDMILRKQGERVVNIFTGGNGNNHSAITLKIPAQESGHNVFK